MVLLKSSAAWFIEQSAKRPGQVDRFALKDPRMSVLARNNGHLAGDGLRAMVFVHGFGCDQNMWRFVEPEFRGGLER